MKLGSYAHSTNILPEFERQGHQAQKTKNVAFCLGVILWGAVLVWHFLGEPSSGVLPRRWENQRMLSSFVSVYSSAVCTNIKVSTARPKKVSQRTKKG